MSLQAVRVPRQERAKRTRAALVDAARREFSERGYAAATARSIAERAGVATGSFYQYFTDKDALLREIGVGRMRAIGEQAVGVLDTAPADGEPVDRQARARMREVVAAVTDYHREDPGLHAVLTERRHADPELDRLTSEAESQLVRAIAGLLERWQVGGDVEATAFVLFGTVEGAVHAHVLGQPMVSDERFFDALVNVLVRIALPIQSTP